VIEPSTPGTKGIFSLKGSRIGKEEKSGNHYTAKTVQPAGRRHAPLQMRTPKDPRWIRQIPRAKVAESGTTINRVIRGGA